MRLTIEEVLKRLRAEGLASDADEEAVRALPFRSGHEDMPWYMRAAVGIGAWAATAFLLGFLFGISVLDDAAARIVAGAVLLGGAVWTRRRSPSEFVRHATVAAALAGQALIVVGVGSSSDSGVLAGMLGVLLSLVLIVVMPDPVHRFLSVLVGLGCAIVVAVDLRWSEGLEVITILVLVGAALAWRSGANVRSAAVGEILEPAGYGLVVATFAILLFSAMTGGFAGSPGPREWAVGPATTTAVGVLLIFLVSTILREHGRPQFGREGLAAFVTIAVLCALTLSSPGVIAGAAALILGFDRRNTVLMGFASLFLLIFGPVYYQSLDLTLIEKAGVLVASGAVMLGARALLVRRAGPGAEAG